VSVVQIADGLPLHTRSEAEIDQFARLAAERNIELELAARGFALDHLRTYIALANRLKARVLRIVDEPPSGEAGLQDYIEVLRAVAPDCARNDVRLAIENYDRFPVAQIRQIVQAVNSPFVGTCLDPTNSLASNEDTVRVFDALEEFAFCLHMKDIAIRRAPDGGGLLVVGCPMGEGQLDIAGLVARAQRTGRAMNVIIEAWLPWQGSLEESLRAEWAWAEGAVRYLKALTGEA
jgi:sugar phosphate isomerase/epimerase